MYELKEAILNKGLSLADFDSSNFAYDKITTDKTRPRCDFMIFPISYSFDSANIYESFFVQFTLWGTDYDDLSDMASNIIDAFDFCEDLIFSSYKLVACIRDNPLRSDRHLGLWRIIGTYEIELEKTR